jgi:hypothetical protein
MASQWYLNAASRNQMLKLLDDCRAALAHHRRYFAL